MSGVYIKGLKMPKLCEECEFIQYGGMGEWCYITEKDIQPDVAHSSTPTDCPLVFVTDHGYLVLKDGEIVEKID